MSAKKATRPVARSVQAPETLDDLFDQIDNVTRAKALLAELGLLAPKIVEAIDATQAEISARVAARIKFPPGGRPVVVRHVNDQTAAESLFAYTAEDGVDRFESLQVIDATEYPIDAEPAADGPQDQE